jgi:hypothetical protein
VAAVFCSLQLDNDKIRGAVDADEIDARCHAALKT